MAGPSDLAGSSEVHELLRQAAEAHERAIACISQERSAELLSVQEEVSFLREQLAFHGIIEEENGKWRATRAIGEESNVEYPSSRHNESNEAMGNHVGCPVQSFVIDIDTNESATAAEEKPESNSKSAQSRDRASALSFSGVVLEMSPQTHGGRPPQPLVVDIDLLQEAHWQTSGETPQGTCSSARSSQPESNNLDPPVIAHKSTLHQQSLELRQQWTVHPQSEHANSVVMMATKTKMEKVAETKRRTMQEYMAIQSQKSTGRCDLACESLIVQPGANWRLVWDLSGAVLIGFDTIMIPFGLSFQPPQTPFSIFMDWLTMLFWTADMVLTFFVGFIERDRLVMSPRLIAKRYFLTWFILDILVVAGDWFNNVGSATSGGSSSASQMGKMVRSFRAIRVLRLLRLLKLRRMMAELQDHISSEYTYLLLNVTRLLCFILFLNHGIACLWYYIGRTADADDRPNWVKHNEVRDAGIDYQYTTALHWTLTQFTPASMEVVPENTEERTMSVIVLMFALVVFSSFVGSMSTSMTALRNINADTNKQFWMLRRFLKQQSVTKQVGRRILKYLEYVVEKKSGKVQQANVKILSMLSPQLQEELTYELTCPQLMGGTFFPYYLGFPLMDVVVRHICAKAMKTLTVATADVIFYPGDEAKHIYCFLGGEIEIEEDDRKIYPPVQELEWIAETALWVNWRHQCKCEASQESDIITTQINEFVQQCRNSVVSWTLAAKYGKIFVQALTQSRTGASDLVRDLQVKEKVQKWCEKEHESFWEGSMSAEADGTLSGNLSGFRQMAKSMGANSRSTTAAVMSSRMSKFRSAP